ncbi:MAG: thioredoxin family protein [Bacilli bacterium]
MDFSMQEFEQLINKPRVIVYFTTPSCSVCKAFFPKLQTFLNKITNIELIKINIEQHPLLRGQLLIFSVPTLIVFIDGKEVWRQSRFLDLYQLDAILNKY